MSRVCYSALSIVFAERSYVLLASVAGLSVLIVATWLPNFSLVWQVIASGSIPLPNKIEILTALVRSLSTNFTAFSRAITIAMAVLFGMNVAMIVYYHRSRRALMKPLGSGVITTSVGGLASGSLGVGCAACGTLILSPVLTFLGAGTLITTLPLGGEEFGLAGLVMLVLSLLWGAKKVGQLTTCRPEVGDGQH